MSKARKPKKGLCFQGRPVEQPRAAGIDLGAREIFVAVHQDPGDQPVRRFGTFTEDLERMAEWLVGCGVTTVAMESTGVYWIPVFEILERRGLHPCLVNARPMKNVPGRRTDWHECQWIQFLHSVGLLRSAFRPEDQVCAVRALVRHRRRLVEMAAQHVQHIHQSLTQMNLQIHHVISKFTGTTGLAMLDAIVDGQRDPAELAKLRDPRIKADRATIAKSLLGNWREEHLFTLRQWWNPTGSTWDKSPPRLGDRDSVGRVHSPRGPGKTAAAGGHKEEPKRGEAPPQDRQLLRLRSSHPKPTSCSASMSLKYPV